MIFERIRDKNVEEGANCTEKIRMVSVVLSNFLVGFLDPDLMKGDGIYSRYWSPVASGPGSYAIDVIVVDNGNTAYSWTDGFIIPETGKLTTIFLTDFFCWYLGLFLF